MKIKIEIQLIELEDDNLHLVVTSDFPDGQTGNWIIDTGASKTVFDSNLENLYQIEDEKTEQVHTAGIGDKTINTAIGTLNSFSIGKMKFEHLRVALIDLSHINKYYSQAAGIQICGLLGGDFLLNHKAVIDYRRQIVVLEKRKV